MAQSKILQQAGQPDREELTERVLEALPKSLDADHRAALDTFIPAWVQGVPIDELSGLSPEDLAGAAMSHWQLASTLNSNHPVFRVFNPSFEGKGWQSLHTIIEVVAIDQPWLVSSLRSALVHSNHEIHVLAHPVMRIQRDKAVQAVAINPPEDSPPENGDLVRAESFIHIQIDCVQVEDHPELISLVETVFTMLRAIREDRAAMNVKIEQMAARIKDAEQSEFVAWLDERQFALLGTGILTPASSGTGFVLSDPLGILDGDAGSATWSVDDLLPEEIPVLEAEVIICKAGKGSPLIRDEHADLILMPNRDENGGLISIDAITGLFVSGLQNEAISNIPWLRERVERVILASGTTPDSYDGKAIAATLRGLPRDMLLQTRSERLLDMATGIVALNERQQVRLFRSSDPLGRFRNCLVYLPRDTYSRSLRLSIEQILLAHIEGKATSYDTRFSSDSALARLHFVIQLTPPLGRDIDWTTIENRIRQASVTWEDRLELSLREQHDENTAIKLNRRYCKAFPASYREDYSARTAAADIDFIEHRFEGVAPVMSFYRHIVSDSRTVNFKMFALHNPVPLSDVIPVIENMGLRVEAEHPFEVHPIDGDVVWVHEFTVQEAFDAAPAADDAAHRIQSAFGEIWRGAVENDGFNRLILAAGLDWRQVVILRALCKYLLQIGVPFSQAYMIDSLVGNASIASLLVRLFEERFDPAASNDCSTIIEQIDAALDEVASLDEDRILRSYRNIILNTLRTNAWRRNEAGEHRDFLSFKLDSQKIPDLPLPRPLFEIFVYSAAVEGIHLRGGTVARGGLRWSDRREDFRTEVLGLMKAQMVKNAVIVPVGSKGGFHVKRALPEDRSAMMEAVIDCYKDFLSGLLDVTDNIVEGSIVPPPDVVRHDEDDPYLVVAADKGTATFSDYANSVAIDYGFWLGDAFASGGSVGYDHKAMGITARGAWESVKRHFRTLGIDTQNEDFTAAGIGDMGGDVFGNGMLLSKHICLVAAFNHQHIFIDPTPDAASSWDERARLFALPRSSWSDYNTSLISKGGGIFSRQDKQIKLSPEAQAVLSIEEEVMTPIELISRILQAKVDLLWNGGIGTYVKAASETHADVADRANDGLRINGRDLNCRVMGEGGNLGFSQRGRIEYARKGGLIYTDAIDNSAGVDCSDHEVNIKILLNSVVAGDDMTVKQRDTLLETMTDEVGLLVLQDNYLQTQCIDLCAMEAAGALDEQARLMQFLEQGGRLDREIEYLPDTEEIADRLANEIGLVRPEISVVVSYSKMIMYTELLASRLPEDPALETVLVDYFPTPLRTTFLDQIRTHRLRREIIATIVTNELVNRLGPTFAFRMHQELGAEAHDVAAAFVVASNIFQMPTLWGSIEALDNQVDSEVQYRMQILVRGLVERATHWLLRARKPAQGIQPLIDRYGPGMEQLMAAMPDCLASEQKETLDQRVGHFSGVGVPDSVAMNVARVVPLSSALDVVEIAHSVEQPIGDIAAVYFQLGGHLDLYWLRDRIGELRMSSHWHTLAASELRSDLHYQQRHLCAEITSSTDATESPEERVNAWVTQNAATVRKYEALIAEMKASPVVDFAMLSLAVNEVHKLLQSERALAS